MMIPEPHTHSDRNMGRVHHRAPVGSAPGWRDVPSAIRGRLKSLNDRIEAGWWGDIGATVLFGIWASAMFFFGGFLQ